MKKNGPRGFVLFPQDYFGDVQVRLMPGHLRIFWVEAFFLMAESPERGVLLQKNGKPYTEQELATAMNLSLETIEAAHHYVLEKGIADLDRRSKALMNRKMVRAEMQRKVNEKNAKKGGNPSLKSAKTLTETTSVANSKDNQLEVSVIPSDKAPDNLPDNSRARVPDPEPDPEPDPVLPRPVHNSLNIDSPPTEKHGGRSRDAASDLFIAKCLERTGSAYLPEKADFVMLAKLRRAFQVEARARPPGWEEAVEHYFASPLGQYSLADLANPKRYAVFKNSALDEFNKPVNRRNGNARQESKGERLVREQHEAGERARDVLRGTTGNGTGGGSPDGTDSPVRPRLVGSD